LQTPMRHYYNLTVQRELLAGGGFVTAGSLGHCSHPARLSHVLTPWTLGN
jgi:hypothetical protein